MIELVGAAIIAGGLTVYSAATSLVGWRKRRRLARIKRVQREIAETQAQLEAMARCHDAWLRDQAFEARKALIQESFRASHQANTSVDRQGSKIA